MTVFRLGGKLNTEFGVESSIRTLLDPRGYRYFAQSSTFFANHARQRPAPSFNPRGGRLGLPADFLIAKDGRLLACKYGAHADDQWSVDEVLDLARLEHGSTSPRLTRMDGGAADEIETVTGIRK